MAGTFRRWKKQRKQQKKQQIRSEKAQGDLYCRTSSKANENGASMPMDQRKQFKQLLDDAPSAGIKKIFVESARAISRDADIGEEIYKKAKDQGIEICCKDSPGLFSLNPSPVVVMY